MNEHPDTGFDEKRFFRWIFILVTSILTVLHLLTMGFISAIYYSNDLEFYRIQESSNVRSISRNIEYALEYVFSDALMFAGIPELDLYFTNPGPATLRNLQQSFYRNGKYRDRYDQIRYLDVTGKEIVRMQKDGHDFRFILGDALKDKSDRYYFQESIGLEPEHIYISPFDLNVEGNIIEDKPMIRFTTPVYDSIGTFHGIIVLNYLGSIILDKIEQSANPDVYYWLVNADGYWLKSHDEADEWTFMNTDSDECTVATRYPEAWDEIIQSGTGSLRNDNGLFNYNVIYPLRATHTEAVDSRSDYYWYLISLVPHDHLRDKLLSHLKHFGVIALIMELVALLSAALFASAVARRKAVQIMLTEAAQTDFLTGLPNRRTFSERFELERNRAERYGHPVSLAMADIDLFKRINDTYGHNDGDEVLKSIAQTFREHLRATDIVARWGGEEYIFLFSETGIENCHTAIEKLRQTIEQTPITTLNNSISVTMSFGLTEFRDGESLEVTAKRADEALYRSKSNGRNQTTML